MFHSFPRTLAKIAATYRADRWRAERPDVRSLRRTLDVVAYCRRVDAERAERCAA